MANDEQLREALLELQLLRRREAQTLEDTRTLAACLEAYSTAASAEDALAALLAQIAATIHADGLMLVTRDEDALRVFAAREAAMAGARFRAPLDLFKRSRNIARPAPLGRWGDALGIDADTRLLVCPAGANLCVMALRRTGAPFAKSDQGLVERLAPLTAQAMRNVEVSREKDLLSAAISGSSSGIAIADATDPAMPLVYVNTAFERLSGYRAEEVLGSNCRFLAADPPDAPERARLRAAIAARSPGTFLLRNRRKSGSLFWNELSLFPVHAPDGSLRNLVATQTDVSPRIEASLARDQARAQMSMALSASEDAFLILERDGNIALSNDAMRALCPAPAHDWRIGSSFEENWSDYLATAEDFPGRITRMIREADLRALSRVPVGQEVDLPDGRTVFVRCAALEDGGMVVTATDISPMKSAQNLLSQRLAAIEAAPDGIAVADPGGRLTYLNSAAATLLGFRSATAALGRIWWHQYDNRKELETMAPVVPTLAQLDTGAAQIHEVTASPLDTGGRVILMRDVTEKLAQEAREEHLTQHLIAMQRQEALSQVTAGVAHDFNNYLAAINGSATLLDLADDLPAMLRGHVQRITAAGTQAARLVNRLLDLGTGSADARNFDLNSALKDLPDLVNPLLPAPIDFDIFRSGGSLVLRGDPAVLNDVLLNVILNARDAIAKARGTITLSTRAHVGTGDEVDALRLGTLRPRRRYAGITIRDTGPGMTPETQAKIFEPYFSTKGGRGTGLGMTMVAAQIKAVGGAIALESAPGLGSTFTLYWPLVEPGAEGAADLSRDASGTGTTPAGRVDLGGRLLIIVDDDAQVGDVMAGYLEAQGAEVVLVENPEDALEAITEDPEAWSALITDYDMPQMTGGALAQGAAEVAPALPIVVVTALARRLNDPRLDRAQVRDILPKPVDLARLSAVIAEATMPRPCDATGATDETAQTDPGTGKD